MIANFIQITSIRVEPTMVGSKSVYVNCETTELVNINEITRVEPCRDSTRCILWVYIGEDVAIETKESFDEIKEKLKAAGAL